ncbi:T9SS type A sorting domain-containing protein [Ekhidna sp.]|uniref:T9SS type A sorting domain-containing protein n=1 Tax=Ekhidna sp. TaxID=2608089 RepID=UPI003B5B88D7
MYIRLGLTTLFSCTVLLLSAQSLVGAAGDSQSSNTYRLAWSLGELAPGTVSNSNYTLTQGLHQGITVKPLGTASEVIAVSVYPNPVSNWLNITLQETTGWSYRLVSQEGKKILHEDRVSERAKQVDLSALNAGIYLLQIDQSNTSTSFRIIVNR